MSTARSFVPRPRLQGIVREDIDGETLLYVEATHQASCLNAPAARIWALCDGRRNVEDIAACAHVEAGIVAHTLGQFAQSGLLENTLSEATRSSLSRRRLLMGVGLAAIPLVLMVTAPKARAASSCTVGTNNGGTPCNDTTHLCCVGLCNETIGTCN